jgi:hypothetical protein
MSKQLLVSSKIQLVLMNDLLLNEIQYGFWKDQRPVDHGAAWNNVQVLQSETNVVGCLNGFTPLRFYDFLNSKFLAIHEQRIMELSRTIKPGIAFKTIKKELIELARIIGGRLTDKTQEPVRVFRGNNRKDYDVVRISKVNNDSDISRKILMVREKSHEALESCLEEDFQEVQNLEPDMIMFESKAGAMVRRKSIDSVPVLPNPWEMLINLNQHNTEVSV